MNTSYVRALTAVGLVPLLVPPLLDPGQTAVILDAVSGIVLTGGDDVHPFAYGVSPHPRLEDTDPERDTMELALFRGATERRLPVLAICRGIQLVNVALGGTLLQDLPSEYPSCGNHAGPRCLHGLRTAPDSLLQRTIGAVTTVNSRHHQAVRDLAPGLRAVAWAEDGVIEAVEWEGARGSWMLAVQWHPEDEADTALFSAFAAAVTSGASTGPAARGPASARWETAVGR